MRTFVAQSATDQAYHLAEGPIWDHVTSRLLWVDIPAGNVYAGELNGSRIEPTAEYHVDVTVSAVAIAADGRLLVAGHQAVYLLEQDGASTELRRLIPAGQRRRLNDGKCDPAGRFLVGTLALGGDVRETLYQLHPDGNVAIIDDDLQMSNGLAWSPDGKVMYSVDTTPGILRARPYNTKSGAWGQWRQLIHIEDGSPDGICVDRDGNLWVAVWGPGEVRQFSPDGEQIGVVRVPAPYTSCVTFAGPNLDTLVISSAIDDLSPQQRALHPESGRLFTAHVGVSGLPTTAWNNKPAAASGR